MLAETFPITVKTLKGLEEILAKEIESIGGQSVRTLRRGVQFQGNLELLYKANLYLRTALRVLVPIAEFNATDEESFYQQVRAIPWEQFMLPEKTLAIDDVVYSETFTHSHFMALKAKDAIVDRMRSHFGQRPDIDTRFPHLRINLHIRDTQCTLSLDSSGEALFRRGYKHLVAEAPLNEVLAAGLVLHTGWDGQSDFVDLMCGSGTLLTEAALIAHNIPPNFYRKQFAFKQWLNYDASLWRRIINNARKQKRDFHYRLVGVDVSNQAIEQARANVAPFYFREAFHFLHGDFETFQPENPCVLLSNPPYGERIKIRDLEKLYHRLGNHLKQAFAGSHTWIFSCNERALKKIGLKPENKYSLRNGQLPCHLAHFPIQSGSYQ